MHVALDDLTGLRAPDFSGGGPWINSEPLSLKGLRGKIVLVDFWTYSCVNCLRTLPYIKEWHRKYSSKGLVIVGVHTPEFDFEKNVENVRDFVSKNDLEYPIVIDNNRAIWDAYANRYWPRKLLVDANGYIRYDHIGEGSYVETEGTIHGLLKEVDADAVLPKVETVEHEHRLGTRCYRITPELYCGYARGAIGNPDGYATGVVEEYKDPGQHVDGRIYLQGEWEAESQYVRHARKTSRPEDYLAIMYHALEVNAVLKPGAGKEVKVYLTRNGKSLDKRIAGEDVVFENGKSVVTVTEPRMYRLTRDTEFGSHDLKLATTSDQLEVFAFTFGGCV